MTSWLDELRMDFSPLIVVSAVILFPVLVEMIIQISGQKWNGIPQYWNDVPLVSRYGMLQKTTRTPRSQQRRDKSLSRDRIIAVSIALLDRKGEGGLTFRSLSERLATGAGAIYWHVENKSDLLTAACDAIVSRALAKLVVGATPHEMIRALALAMFDAINAHPWVGSALMHSGGQLPMVRIVDCLGQQVRKLGGSHQENWAAVSALLHYILGVAGQNAANIQFARTRGTDRSAFLDALATVWSQLDPNDYPFAYSVAARMRSHDDRADFLAGIDLILSGIECRSVAEPSK